MGVLDRLHKSTAEAGDERGLFGLELALRCGGEGAGERESQAGRGDVFSGEAGGDVATDALGRHALGFAACVIVAEIRIGGAEHAAAVFERE